MLNGKRNLHFGIHQSRRHIKILRSALRLIRFDISEKAFKEENKFYRNVGRQLSRGRDLTALLETLEDLISMKSKSKYKPLFDTLKSKILAERKRYTIENRSKIQETGVLLSKHKLITSEIHWAQDYEDNLLNAISHTYRHAYRSHHVCLSETSDENIHEYRKRAKYLRYQILFVSEVWPSIFTALEKELHQLTDFLGQVNNMTVMQKYIMDSNLNSEKREQELNLDLQREKQKMTINALESGIKLFAEKPKYFKKRLKIYLSRWKAL